MNFDKIFDNMAATSKAKIDINLLDKNNKTLKNISEIEIGRFSYNADHELWHVFQNFRYISSIGENFNKSFDPYGWMWESSAEYMGARARNQSNPKINDVDVRDFCNPSLNYEYDDLSSKHILSPDLASSILSNGDSVNYGNYYRFGFFNFLGNPNTKNVGDTEIINVLADFENLSSSANYKTVKATNLHLDKYHDYVVHAYLQDRLDIYKSEKNIQISSGNIKYINKKNLKKNLKNTNGLDIKSGTPLINLSPEYFEIKPDSSLYGNIVIVLNPDKNSKPSTIKMTAIHEKTLTGEKKIIALPLGVETSIVNFKSGTDKLILVVSNSNGTLDTSSSNYDVKVVYTCSGKNSSTCNTGCQI